MRTTAQQKGDNLEDAVSFIEEHLHSVDPGPFKTIKIGTKEKFNEGMHEVDVLVTKEMETGEKVVYIFECKNVDHKPVSKNDVIILNDKVVDYKSKMANYGVADVKGVIVGKSFSVHAVTKAEQFQIQLVTADDILYPILNAPSIKMTLNEDIRYATIAFNSLNPTAVISIQDNPIAQEPITGETINLDQVSFKKFQSELDRLQGEFVKWVHQNANETRRYQGNKILPIMEITPAVNVAGTMVDKLRVVAFFEVWFGMGEFVYAFDVEGKKRILRQSLKTQEGSKIPVTILSEPGDF